jgi:hypothetical protein
MLRTQRLLEEREGALVERFRLLILALFSKQVRQSIEGLGELVMVWAQSLFSDLQGPLQQWFG